MMPSLLGLPQSSLSSIQRSHPPPFPVLPSLQREEGKGGGLEGTKGEREIGWEEEDELGEREGEGGVEGRGTVLLCCEVGGVLCLSLCWARQVYTVWNYRKEGIAAVLDGEDREAAAAAAQEELVLTEKALMKNPKSYSSWQHRKVPDTCH